MQSMQLRSVMPQRCSARRAATLAPRAAATRTSDGWSTESAYERVLRYPDGKVREKS